MPSPSRFLLLLLLARAPEGLPRWPRWSSRSCPSASARPPDLLVLLSLLVLLGALLLVLPPPRAAAAGVPSPPSALPRFGHLVDCGGPGVVEGLGCGLEVRGFPLPTLPPCCPPVCFAFAFLIISSPPSVCICFAGLWWVDLFHWSCGVDSTIPSSSCLLLLLACTPEGLLRWPRWSRSCPSASTRPPYLLVLLSLVLLGALVLPPPHLLLLLPTSLSFSHS